MAMGLINMLKDHPFWASLTVAVLVWYSTVTIYVAIKGIGDIRRMLRRLSDSKDAPGSGVAS
ncbi:MAG: hypothetical protein MUC88_20170 [Planctomycetes bacterium]|jgi:hypothetical protein|nr:hypothetical protein [Planctomycetota bacterium]